MDKKTETPFQTFRSIALAVILALIFRSVIASPYKIPSGSMIPTLKIGDFIFVSKLSYGLKIPFTNKNLIRFAGPKRGDVIVFVEPEKEKVDFIKRVIGLPGDKIEVKSDILFINDKAVERVEDPNKDVLYDHPFPTIQSMARLYTETFPEGNQHTIMEFKPRVEDFGPYVVPDDQYFMMGDNRDSSSDSRFWGFLPRDNIRGKAKFIWLSLDSVNPYFSASKKFVIPSIRFHRFGKKVN
ncbi:MAG: signal peptidase I [Bdellovibrionota bacterium]|nr:signal peptidase I [Deltaproteobacteria bacterium]